MDKRQRQKATGDQLVTQAFSTLIDRLARLERRIDQGHVPMIRYVTVLRAQVYRMRSEFVDRCMIESGEKPR